MFLYVLLFWPRLKLLRMEVSWGKRPFFSWHCNDIVFFFRMEWGKKRKKENAYEHSICTIFSHPRVLAEKTHSVKNLVYRKLLHCWQKIVEGQDLMKDKILWSGIWDNVSVLNYCNKNTDYKNHFFSFFNFYYL